MHIGVGLPNTVPGTNGRRLVEWAKRSEELGFDTLSTIGRVVFPTHDELIALAAAAAVTERINLFTNVLLEPTRDPVLLAREAASIDQISGGRFVLGLGAGWRRDDFDTTGRTYHDRGRRMDTDLDLMGRIWRGEQVMDAQKVLSPTPTNGEGVPMAFGGSAPAAVKRMAKYGIGWTAGGSGPDGARDGFQQARDAWHEAGRNGDPKLWALAYWGLGDEAHSVAESYLTDYYGDWGSGMAAGIPKDKAAIQDYAHAYAEAGTDVLVLVPTNSDLVQLDLLHDALEGITAVDA
jgi:alkanesulfonate monooxygenase SsuD/methylene tetrahydromethanopterin reductase-like flavin-dependent oxidoreductase (luciferase family)